MPTWTSHEKLPTPTSHRLPTSTWWPLFSADDIVFKKKFNFFFDPEKVNGPQNQPRRFYFTVQPRPQTTDHSPQPRIDFSCYEISVPDICSLICEPNMMKTVIFRSFAQLLRNFDLKICMYCIWHFQILEVTYAIHIFKLKLPKSCALRDISYICLCFLQLLQYTKRCPINY